MEHIQSRSTYRSQDITQWLLDPIERQEELDSINRSERLANQDLINLIIEQPYYSRGQYE